MVLVWGGWRSGGERERGRERGRGVAEVWCGAQISAALVGNLTRCELLSLESGWKTCVVEKVRSRERTVIGVLACGKEQRIRV